MSVLNAMLRPIDELAQRGKVVRKSIVAIIAAALLISGAGTAADASPRTAGGQRTARQPVLVDNDPPVGLSSEISRTIVVDTTAPTITGLRPAHKAFVRGTSRTHIHLHLAHPSTPNSFPMPVRYLNER